MECGAALSVGDIVLMEQQMHGPAAGANDYVPMEWSKPVYDAIVTLVANGIVVVETSGNGGQNLDDDTLYESGNDGHWPFKVENDSGALMVTGAQSPHSPTPRSYHWWSNYGETVDLQGWGDAIVTTGNGGLLRGGGTKPVLSRRFRRQLGGRPHRCRSGSRCCSRRTRRCTVPRRLLP
jgi:hypothetical protein